MTKVENWKHRKKLCDIIPTPYPSKLNYRPLVDFALGSSSLFLSICHMKDFHATLARKQEWNLQRCGLQWRRTILDTKMLF